MDKLYNELLCRNFSYEQIYQLIFLFNYDENSFSNLMKSIDCSYSVSLLEQIIKCITHNIPYDLFLDKKTDINSVIEIRRYLEDSLEKDLEHKEDYIYLAKTMISNKWEPSLIYEFRRFFKCSMSFSYHQIKKIYDLANTNKHWVIMACLYDMIYKYNDFDKAFSYFKSQPFLALMEKWKQGDKKSLLQLMEKTRKE